MDQKGFRWIGTGSYGKVEGKRKLRNKYSSFEFGELVVSQDDYVNIRNDGHTSDAKYYVGRILCLYEDDKNASGEYHRAVIQWFCRLCDVDENHLDKVSHYPESEFPEMIMDCRQFNNDIDAETICSVIKMVEIDADLKKEAQLLEESERTGEAMFVVRWKYDGKVFRAVQNAEDDGEGEVVVLAKDRSTKLSSKRPRREMTPDSPKRRIRATGSETPAAEKEDDAATSNSRQFHLYQSQTSTNSTATGSTTNGRPKNLANMLESPRRTANLLESPRRTANLLESPRRTANLLDSPRRSANLLESPRRTAHLLDSPRRPMYLLHSPKRLANQVESPERTAHLLDSPRRPMNLLDSPRRSMNLLDSPTSKTLEIKLDKLTEEIIENLLSPSKRDVELANDRITTESIERATAVNVSSKLVTESLSKHTRGSTEENESNSFYRESVHNNNDDSVSDSPPQLRLKVLPKRRLKRTIHDRNANKRSHYKESSLDDSSSISESSDVDNGRSSNVKNSRKSSSSSKSRERFRSSSGATAALAKSKLTGSEPPKSSSIRTGRVPSSRICNDAGSTATLRKRISYKKYFSGSQSESDSKKIEGIVESPEVASPTRPAQQQASRDRSSVLIKAVSGGEHAVDHHRGARAKKKLVLNDDTGDGDSQDTQVYENSMDENSSSHRTRSAIPKKGTDPEFAQEIREDDSDSSTITFSPSRTKREGTPTKNHLTSAKKLKHLDRNKTDIAKKSKQKLKPKTDGSDNEEVSSGTRNSTPKKSSDPESARNIRELIDPPMAKMEIRHSRMESVSGKVTTPKATRQVDSAEPEIGVAQKSKRKQKPTADGSDVEEGSPGNDAGHCSRQTRNTTPKKCPGSARNIRERDSASGKVLNSPMAEIKITQSGLISLTDKVTTTPKTTRRTELKRPNVDNAKISKRKLRRLALDSSDDEEVVSPTKCLRGEGSVAEEATSEEDHVVNGTGTAKKGIASPAVGKKVFLVEKSDFEDSLLTTPKTERRKNGSSPADKVVADKKIAKSSPRSIIARRLRNAIQTSIGSPAVSPSRPSTSAKKQLQFTSRKISQAKKLSPDSDDNSDSEYESPPKSSSARTKRQMARAISESSDSFVESGDDDFEDSDRDSGNTSDSDFEPKKKRKLRTNATAKSPATPRSKVKKPKRDMTPHLPKRQTAPTDPDDVGTAATVRAQLHQSVVPDSLPCREEEFDKIISFVEGKVSKGAGGCMYICGVPGTGKTATVSEVLRSLVRSSEAGDLPKFTAISLNGMKMTDPQQAYVKFYQDLTGKKVTAAHARDLLEKKYSTKGKKGAVVLLVDELDRLMNRKQDVIYNLFNWPNQKDSKLVVLAIANTMDLPEKMHKRVFSRVGLSRITFKAYNFRQLEEILLKRMLGHGLFTPDALQLIARKVAALSGDARRALDICRRATEIIDLHSRGPGRGKGVVVGMDHVSRAITEMFESPKIDAIRCSSLQEQIFLRAVVMEFERAGVEESIFSDVFKQHCSLCRQDGYETPNVSEAMSICSRLGSATLLSLEHGRKDIGQKIRLNVSVDDVAFALTE